MTLRFLCRIREEEILEPLVPSILTNLEHRHSYVRRNAVLAVNAICKLPKGDLLMPVRQRPPSSGPGWPVQRSHRGARAQLERTEAQAYAVSIVIEQALLSQEPVQGQ